MGNERTSWCYSGPTSSSAGSELVTPPCECERCAEVLIGCEPGRSSLRLQEADMASHRNSVNVRREMVDELLERIATERNPSVNMMDLVEQLLTPDDVPVYTRILMDKVKTARYPNVNIIRRLRAFR